MKNNRMLSREAAAEFLGCTMQTVTNWVNRGIIKGHMIKGRLFVDAKTLEAVVDTVSEIEETKRKIKEIRDAYAKECSVMEELLNGKRRELRLYGCSVIPNIPLQSVIAILNSYKGNIPDMELAALRAIVLNGSTEIAAEKSGINKSSLIRFASRACKRIGNTSIDSICRENEELRRRLTELREECENAKLGRLPEVDSKLLGRKITDFDTLSVRALNCLQNAGVKTVGDLVRMKPSNLLKYRNCGKRTLAEVRDFLNEHGLDFAKEC